MKRIIVCFLVSVLVSPALFAQTHNSVSVEETELYRLLEIAEITGLIDRLPSARPLSASAVKKALRQIEESRAGLSAAQKGVLDDYVARFAVNKDQSILLDGDLRYESEVFPLTWGFYFENEFKMDLAKTDQWGTHNFIGGRLGGDLGKSISYGFDINAQANKVNIDDNAPYPHAWAPYTYTKRWDAGARSFRDPPPLYLMPRQAAMGWSLQPEITLSLWENRFDLRFSRLRRDWGLGEGNLFLDEQARPFFGLEGTLTPWKWLSFTFLFGGLEFGPTFRNSPFASGSYTPEKGDPSNQKGADYTIGPKEIAQVQQNMLSIFQVEFAPAPWLYISLFDAVVYLKRFELGYMFPFMSKLFHQNNTGDYDNLLFGATLALGWPGYFRVYGTWLIDEWNPLKSLNALRQSMAIQAGIKGTIPMGLWNLLTFQYTKIEPYTYTHYAAIKSPWYYSTEMESGYQNNGENLGSYLEPNSDEFLFGIHLQPARGWTTGFKYRMIRHGTGPGSEYDTWGYERDGGADGDKNGAYWPDAPNKDFLKDGRYEWFHVFSLGGSVDLRGLFVPAQFSLQYSFVYEYDTNFKDNKNLNPLSGTENHRHLVGLNLKIFPK